MFETWIGSTSPRACYNSWSVRKSPWNVVEASTRNVVYLKVISNSDTRKILPSPSMIFVASGPEVGRAIQSVRPANLPNFDVL